MSIKPYYTSDDLIDAVKRKCAIPIAQETFSEEDILAFANEEMFLSQVPSILQFHEEYLVYEHPAIALRANISKYPIPKRAIGMKLRDVFYKDDNGALYEMSKISPDDKSFFQGNTGNYQSSYHYYLQNNSIVLIPDIGANVSGSLVVTYYLRPNSLVPNDQAAICTGFSKTITVENLPSAGDTITVNGTEFIAGTDFAIGANESATASNLSVALNADDTVASTANATIVVTTYEQRELVIASDSASFTIQSTITINFDNVPDNITNYSYVDFIETDGGHQMFSFDVRLGTNVISQNTITFPEADVPSDFAVGDYLCSQYECIIPQIPSDLHNLLAERTCARILESLGDREGLKVAKEHIQEMESRQATLIDNRVEGSPQKVFNRHSLLRTGKSSRGR